jgi:hypothetical protein
MSGQLNVNQFALPGMEEHAHAGARHLAMGRGFLYERTPLDAPGDAGNHTLEMYAPESGRMARVGHLEWSGSNVPEKEPPFKGHYPGEINRVGTNRFFQHQGIASTLYKMADDPNVFTGDDTRPLHSTMRTRAGEAWSKAVGGWDPDLHPYSARPRHPFEVRGDVDRRAHRREVPGQLELPS